MNKPFNLVILIFIFAFSFILQELPSNFAIQKILPEWPFIIMLFAIGHGDKQQFGLFGAFIIGLLQDAFLDTPFGINAFIYTLSGYILMSVFARNKNINIISQATAVFFLVLFKYIILNIFNTISYGEAIHYWGILSVFFSFFAWIILYYIFLIFSL